MYEQTSHPLCQSCGMPMQKPADFGTNADHSPTREYCTHCYQAGAFTAPDITMTQMIEQCVSMMIDQGIPTEDAKAEVATTIPTLKRWYQ